MELRATIEKKGKIFEGKAPEIIRKNLEEFIFEGTEFLEREVKLGTPTGVYGTAGGLVSTIHGEVVGKGTAVVKGVVGHMSKYGDVIEKGRTAGAKWPPEGVLAEWIEKKLNVAPEDVKRVEFLVRRKIGRRGFPGAHMFENAFKRGWSRLMQMADRMGFNITKDLNS